MSSVSSQSTKQLLGYVKKAIGKLGQTYVNAYYSNGAWFRYAANDDASYDNLNGQGVKATSTGATTALQTIIHIFSTQTSKWNGWATGTGSAQQDKIIQLFTNNSPKFTVARFAQQIQKWISNIQTQSQMLISWSDTKKTYQFFSAFLKTLISTKFLNKQRSVKPYQNFQKNQILPILYVFTQKISQIQQNKVKAVQLQLQKQVNQNKITAQQANSKFILQQNKGKTTVQQKAQKLMQKLGLSISTKSQFLRNFKNLNIIQSKQFESGKVAAANRSSYFTDRKLASFYPIGKGQYNKRGQRVFPQIAARNYYQMKNKQYFSDKQYRDPNNVRLVQLGKNGQATWSKQKKMWTFDKIGQSYLYPTQRTFVQNYDKAIKYRDEKYSIDQALKRRIPQMVKMVFQSDQKFYKYGIGPAFGKRGDLYAGRYMDQINGNLKTIPKPSMKYLNPLSYQQMDFYKKSALLYAWNKYVQQQARYQKWVNITPQKFYDTSKKNLIKSYLQPQNKYSSYFSYMGRYLKFFQKTLLQYKVIGKQSYKNLPLFQKGLYLGIASIDNTLYNKFTGLFRSLLNFKQLIYQRDQYKKAKNKPLYVSLALQSQPEDPQKTWKLFYTHVLQGFEKQSVINNTNYSKATAQTWKQKFEWQNIIKQKTPRLLKQYSGFIAQSKLVQPSQIAQQKKKIQKIQMDFRNNLKAKYDNSLLNSTQSLNKIYSQIFVQQDSFNALQQKLHTGLNLKQDQRKQIKTRNFYDTKQITRRIGGRKTVNIMDLQ